MITLTLNVPNVGPIMAAGYTHLRVLRSSTQTLAGPYVATPPDMPLVGGQTVYSFVDPAGNSGDWYETVFVILPAGTVSSPSTPEPGYLSDVCQATRDKLGVDTATVTDAQLLGFAFLPAALGQVRRQLSTFDTVVAAGGDLGAAALEALVCLTAIKLCSRLRLTVMELEQFKDYRYQRNRQLNWDETIAALQAEFDIAISAAAGETATLDHADVPGVLFAGPTRGGKDTSGGLQPFYPLGGVNAPAPFDPNTGLPTGIDSTNG